MPQIASFLVNGGQDTWTDSGVVLENGDGVHFAVNGAVRVIESPEHIAASEGAYLTPTPDVYNPGAVVQEPEEIGLSGDRICSHLPPFCCAIALKPDSEGPPSNSAGGVDYGIRATQYVFYSNENLKSLLNAEDVGGYRIWAMFNGLEGQFDSYSENFGVNLLTRNGPARDGTWGTVSDPETSWQAG